jgi:5-deoxy-glucuronate isomerase
VSNKHHLPSHQLATGNSEFLILPLEDRRTVATDGQIFELAGRAGVFHAVTDGRLPFGAQENE